MARMTDQGPGLVDEGPPRWARTTGLALLSIFLVFGLVGLEAWPFTGWHLFSTRREPVEASTQAYAVLPDGDEVRVEWLDLPVAFRQGQRQLAGGEERCDGFVAAIRHGFDDLTEVRVYRVRDRLDTDGERTELDRELRYTCPVS
jgi:hypothetical protein